MFMTIRNSKSCHSWSIYCLIFSIYKNADFNLILYSFPPDFDPSKIKRRKMPKDPQQVIRLMAPFSMRCNRCGEYICKPIHSLKALRMRR